MTISENKICPRTGDSKEITSAWDNKGDIVIGNDVWIGFEAVILSGVTVGDGALLVHGQLLKKMYRLIRLLEVFLQNQYENGSQTV